jgi:hypothetical protein
MSIDFFRFSHDEALYSLGEWNIFFLMWHIDDHNAGLVERCSNCYLPFGDVSEVFKQSSVRNCPVCFGTTFEGGYKARIVRPAIWNLNADEDKEQRRGEITRNSASVQSTSDFNLRVGDYLVRGDDSRWQMRSKSSAFLREGFSTASPEINQMGSLYNQCDLEDKSSVSYIIPVSEDPNLTPKNILTIKSHYLPDFSEFEDIRGSLF